LDILDDLLREEGFVDVRYVEQKSPTEEEGVARGELDFGQDFASTTMFLVDAGVPAVMLAGVHLGCVELRARESIRSVVDLKGKNVWAATLWDPGHTMLPIVAASVGLDPAKDLNWVFDDKRDPKDLFEAGEIDAFMTAPPWAQELRGQNVGHVILSSALDRPWSQYFCCMLIGSVDFVRRNPIATKRVVRAMLRATDICTAKPDWVAQRLIDRGVWPRQDSVRQGLDDVSYRAWRDYDVEDSVRFWALSLHEVGVIKSSPDKIIATGTDFRFLNEVRKELGI
jgi:NitT/TauT family transport system substrate-binding protein